MFTISTWYLSVLPWTSFMKKLNFSVRTNMYQFFWWQHFIFQIVMLHWWLVMSGTTMTVYDAAYADKLWMVKWWLLTRKTSRTVARIMTSKWHDSLMVDDRCLHPRPKSRKSMKYLHHVVTRGRMGYSYLMIIPLLSNYGYG